MNPQALSALIAELAISRLRALESADIPETLDVALERLVKGTWGLGDLHCFEIGEKRWDDPGICSD